MLFNEYMVLMNEYQASDMYFTVGAPVAVKIHGLLRALDKTTLSAQNIDALLEEILTEKQKTSFEKVHELNLGINIENLARFRINVFQQRNEPAMVVRRIQSKIPTLQELGMPSVLGELATERQGLILVVGATNSGKSSTLAAMIDKYNQTHGGHIITVEDPIEFNHRHHKSIINQREIGIDTLSYDAALENALRQSPNVIMIGEIRNVDTMIKAIQFAETGHLCLSTLHANNSVHALDRMANLFPQEYRAALLADLSKNLRAIIAQRLIPSVDRERVAAVEVLINTEAISDYIRKDDFLAIPELLSRENTQGLQSFEDALFRLYQDKKITLENAMSYADSEHNLKMKIQLDRGIDLNKAGDYSLS